MTPCSLPFVGLAAVGLVLACLVGSREARDLQRPRCSSGARRGRDGRSARTGSSLAPAHGFSALSLALRPVRDEPYGACSRSPGCTGAGEAWETGTLACPNRLIIPHPPLRALTVRGCDSPGLSEPHPASTTDASGASLVRPGPHSYSQG